MTPNVCKIKRVDGKYEVTLVAYPASKGGLGTVVSPYVGQSEGPEEYYIGSGELGPFTMTDAELQNFLQLEDCPIKFEGEFYWREDLVFDEL
jgi:hypothetical protein